MPSPKTLVKYGAMGKKETTYGTAVSLAATADALDIISPPEPVVDYVHGGERGGKSPAERSSRQRVGRMGKFATFTLAFEPAGGGAAYSATVKPNVYVAMQMGGMVWALSTATGSESYIATPAPAGTEDSATVELYYRGQKYPLAGAYASWEWGGDVPGLPQLKLDAMALVSSDITDVAVPTLTYSQFVNPAKAEGILLKATVGTATFTVGKIDAFSLACDNNIERRALDNVTGLHGGFNMGVERKFTLKATIESEALTTASPYAASAGFNIFKLMENAATAVLSFTVGSTQYYKYTVTAAAAQLVNVTESAKGAASMWECEWELKPSSLTANDEVTITFN
jgi:hypothetical protein